MVDIARALNREAICKYWENRHMFQVEHCLADVAIRFLT